MTSVNVLGQSESALDLLEGHPLLRGLGREALAGLCEQADLLHRSSGETLFREGSTASHCLLVVCGRVEVLRFAENGDLRVFQCFERGQLVAEAAMFMPHERYPMSARAVGATTVWRLARARWRATCMQHPALALRLLELFSQRLYLRINDIEWLTHSNARQRLADYLLKMVPGQSRQITLPISQRQLATQLGMRAETLSRLLADWQACGWVHGERRHWCLIETAALRQLADGRARSF